MLILASSGLSAAILVPALSGSVGGALLAYFAPLPLLLLGLALGFGSAIAACGAAVGLILVAGGPGAAYVYGGMHALPSCLVVRLALRRRTTSVPASPDWPPAGGILCWLAVAGAAVATLVALAGAEGEGIEVAVRGLLGTVVSEGMPQVPEDAGRRLAEGLAPFFVGMSAASWVTMMTVNGALAQGLLARMGRALRPSPRWSAMALPDWISWLLVGAAAVALVAGGDAGYIAFNLVLVFAVPFFFLGLAVVHSLVPRRPARVAVLAAFYCVLAVAFVLMAIVVAGIGIAEQWIGIRRRAGADDDEGT